MRKLYYVASYIYICILFITLFVGIFTSERKEAAVNSMLLAQLINYIASHRYTYPSSCSHLRTKLKLDVPSSYM